MTMSLSKAKIGEKVKVVSLEGGTSFINKLNSLGISKGKIIQKVSSLRLRGPIIVCIDRTNVAIGRGMAEKIIVER